MKRKYKQRWSSIPLISTNRQSPLTITHCEHTQNFWTELLLLQDKIMVRKLKLWWSTIQL